MNFYTVLGLVALSSLQLGAQCREPLEEGAALNLIASLLAGLEQRSNNGLNFRKVYPISPDQFLSSMTEVPSPPRASYSPYLPYGPPVFPSFRGLTGGAAGDAESSDTNTEVADDQQPKEAGLMRSILKILLKIIVAIPRLLLGFSGDNE